MVARARQLEGQRVAVDGPLRRGASRSRGSAASHAPFAAANDRKPGDACCDRVISGLALGEAGAPLDKLVHVGGPETWASFGCAGDEVSHCCTVPVGQRAVALGTVRVEGGRVRLDEALVCTPGL